MAGDDVLELYEPINTLKPVAQGVWVVDGPVVRMRYLWTSLPFTTRMTVVRLADGGLFLHSPIALTPELRTALAGLGPVKHLVSPNRIHYAYIADWARAFPDAIAWASPGVRDRARSQGIEVAFDRDLADAAPPDWSDDMVQTVVRGSRVLEEVVFFHRRSRTLILADLIENFEPSRIKPPYRWLVALSGSCDPDGKLPLDVRLSFVGRKASARRSVRRMISWRPERVILSHGRWYAANGTRELERAFRWLQ
jgi:hypothetical protein